MCGGNECHSRRTAGGEAVKGEANPTADRSRRATRVGAGTGQLPLISPLPVVAPIDPRPKILLRWAGSKVSALISEGLAMDRLCPQCDQTWHVRTNTSPRRFKELSSYCGPCYLQATWRERRADPKRPVADEPSPTREMAPWLISNPQLYVGSPVPTPQPGRHPERWSPRVADSEPIKIIPRTSFRRRPRRAACL